MSELRITKETIPTFFSKFGALQKTVLKIPDYQREYVWGDNNFSRLAEDLIDYIKIEDDKRPDEYYLGNIVLHEDKNEINIVDGQQRLTTLLIIDYILNEDQSVLKKKDIKLSFSFKSKLSRKSINNCHCFFGEYFKDDERKKQIDKALEKIIFITITTGSQDEAFTMFNTQNNRGIKPKVADLLKAVHLRSVINDEKLQESLAKKWEDIEKCERDNHWILPWYKHYFMQEIINTVLWRSRTWKYGNYSFADDDNVEKEFYKALKDVHENTIKVFPGSRNFPDGQINCTSNGDSYIAGFFSLPSSAKDYPITLRQPLERGVTFFRYIEKYFEILKFIFEDHSQEKFREFFDKIYRYQSDYMKQAFVVASMIFVDKFGTDNLLRFAKYWDYATGHLRQFSYRIRVEKYPKYIAQQQLFDKLCNSYTEDELFRQLLEVEIDFTLRSISAPMHNYHNACVAYYNIKTQDDFEKDYLNKKMMLEKNP